jgi:hypothetical protein
MESDLRMVKPKTVILVLAVSPLSSQHYEIRANTGWRVSKFTHKLLFKNKNPTKGVGLVQSWHLHHLIKM